MNKLEEEVAKATGEVLKKLAEDVIRPTSKSIGLNLGLMIEAIFGWGGAWATTQIEKQKLYKEEYIKNINEKVNKISIENLQEPKMNIVGPAIESSKFFYEENYYREMFSNLIASSCDKTKSNSIHPSFSTIIKDLSPLDAKFISMFNSKGGTYPMASVVSQDKEGKLTPYLYYLFNFKEKDNEFDAIEKISLTSSLDNLIRLGLVIKSSDIIELDWDYETFKNDILYVEWTTKVEKEENLVMKKYRLELTLYGRNFLSVCFK